MNKVFEKRRYQERTVENYKKWLNTDGKLATIILPVGTGKTFTCCLCLQNSPNKKILWTAHREELIDQAYNTLKNVITWEHKISKEIGDKKASSDDDIIVGSVQTLAKNRKNIENFKPDIVVIDEYHHRSFNNKTYQSLFDKYPEAKFIGLTATPWRFNGDDLPLGEVLFEMDISTAIKHNYLVPVVPEILQSKVSLAKVGTIMGDYKTKELSVAVNIKERNELIANRIIEMVEDGRQGILFGVDVAHAHDMFLLLKDKIRTVEIYGDTPNEERLKALEKVRNREVDCLVNNLIFTEGFDAPHLSFAVIARPTKNLQLFIQMIGRVLRRFDIGGKLDAIIIDVYDKFKSKQSRITFDDVVKKGDMYGDLKRANNILTAGIPSIKDSLDGNSGKDKIAEKLLHFPVFIINGEQDRWIIDDDFMPITSWRIADGQWLITWSEESDVTRLLDETTWVPMVFKPTLSKIKQNKYRVKHNILGEGTIIDVGFNFEVFVQFDDGGWGGPSKKYVKIEDLKERGNMINIYKQKGKKKIDKLFYFCYPSGGVNGRMVEMKRSAGDLIILKDSRINKTTARSLLIDHASNGKVLNLVKSNASWKKMLASSSQKQLIENWILSGKIRFDLDLNNITKGECSAIIEQMKWQRLIHEKFGTNKKENLIGYDGNSNDV